MGESLKPMGRASDLSKDSRESMTSNMFGAKLSSCSGQRLKRSKLPRLPRLPRLLLCLEIVVGEPSLSSVSSQKKGRETKALKAHPMS